MAALAAEFERVWRALGARQPQTLRWRGMDSNFPFRPILGWWFRRFDVLGRNLASPKFPLMRDLRPPPGPSLGGLTAAQMKDYGVWSGGLRRRSQKQETNPIRPMTTTTTAAHIDHVIVSPAREPYWD
jgi:hypothetical protein